MGSIRLYDAGRHWDIACLSAEAHWVKQACPFVQFPMCLSNMTKSFGCTQQDGHTILLTTSIVKWEEIPAYIRVL